MMQIGFLMLCDECWNRQYAERMFQKSCTALEAASMELIVAQVDTSLFTFGKGRKNDIGKIIRKFRESDITVFVIQFGTFYLDTEITLKFVGELNVPVMLWGIPEPEDGGRLALNSFCALNMHASVLHHMGIGYEYVYGLPCDDVIGKIKSFANAAKAVAALRNAKIGLIGYRAPQFYNINFNELELKKKIGVEVIHTNTLKMQKIARDIGNDEINKCAAWIAERVVGPSGVIEKYAGAVCAFRRLAEEQELSAIVPNCWAGTDAAVGFSSCLAGCALIDGGVMCGCEGDVLGTISMLIQFYLSGHCPFLADLVDFNNEHNDAIFWHAGHGPLSLANREIQIESNNGVVEFYLPLGKRGLPVTIMKLSYADRFRMFSTGGRAVESEQVMPGASAIVEMDANLEDVRDTVIHHGIEHHFSLLFADIERELDFFCKLTGIDLIRITESRH